MLAGGFALVLVGIFWGSGVFGAMNSDAFGDPGSESSRAAERIIAETGQVPVDVIVLYSAGDRTVDEPEFAAAVRAALTKVRERAEVASVLSVYDSPSPALVSTDRHATYAAVTLTESGSEDQFEAIRADLVATGDVVRTQIGGSAAVGADIGQQLGDDIARAELFSMPVLLILLILVFRSVVAAMMPLLVGVLAILGALIVTRLVTYAMEVSVFSINIVTLIGLGMAVDYALLLVSRFREELAAGRDVPDAVRAMMETAGRTVLVSGLTVALALSSLLVFPQAFLRSMGVGGTAAVAVAMLAALTVLPALLAVLGPRLNALRVPLPRRRSRLARVVSGPADSSPAVPDSPEAGHGTGGWARLARMVMRRPVLVLAGTVALLGLLTMPFLRAEFGGTDVRVLPPGTESRVVSERIDAEFPGGDEKVSVLVSGADQSAVTAFADDISALPRVTAATTTAARGGSSVISVAYAGDNGGPVARGIVNDIRDLPAPGGAEVLVGGRGAEVEDLIDGLGERLPLMVMFATVSTMLVLFLAFGSIVLPIKAVLMNLVSIGAAFGALVWIFQDGHLSGFLGFTSTGDLEASQLILILALLFGLSTDYEVFLLSRIREEWDRTGDNTTAVAHGLQRTAGIISMAALLLIVVIAGFATGGILFIKMIGVGMLVAIIVDATIVRALLVPATMRLLGRANWWLPAPLAGVYRRFGFKESRSGGPAHAEPPPVISTTLGAPQPPTGLPPLSVRRRW